MRAARSGLVIVLVMLTAGCSLFGEKGNGHVRTEERSLSNFDAIDVSGGFEADVSVGGPQRLSVTTDENLLPLVRTTIRDGHLVVEPTRALRPSILRVTVFVPALVSVSVSGGVRANVRGIAAQSFRVRASGGASLTLSGTAQRFDADLSGGVSLSAGTLATGSTALDASGGVRAEVNALQSIEGSVSGGVSLRVSGNPARRSMSTSGGSSVQYL